MNKKKVDEEEERNEEVDQTALRNKQTFLQSLQLEYP